MRMETPLTVFAVIASVARLSGAARKADHHMWAKKPREITSNSLLDLEDNVEPILGGGGSRQRVPEMPDLRNIRRCVAAGPPFRIL